MEEWSPDNRWEKLQPTVPRKRGIQMKGELIPILVECSGKTWAWELGGWSKVRAHGVDGAHLFFSPSCSQGTTCANAPTSPPHTHNTIYKNCDGDVIQTEYRASEESPEIKMEIKLQSAILPHSPRMPTGWQTSEDSFLEKWTTQEKRSPYHWSERQRFFQRNLAPHPVKGETPHSVSPSHTHRASCLLLSVYHWNMNRQSRTIKHLRKTSNKPKKPMK